MCVYTLVSCTCHPHGSKLGLAFALNVPMMVISKKTENETTKPKKTVSPSRVMLKTPPYGCFQNRDTPKWMVYNGKPYKNG